MKNQLIDRFGPIPEQGKELMKSFELRWLAQELGIEKLVMKSNKMVGFFISDSQSKFFESSIFQGLLLKMQRNVLNCQLAEKNDRLRLVFPNIRNVDEAYKALEFVLAPIADETK